MVTRPLFRRRRFLVDMRIQLRFIWLLFLQMVVIIVLMGYFSYSHIEEIQTIAFADPNLHHTTRTSLLDHTAAFYRWMAGACCLVTILLIIFGILASHKIAGPIHKLKSFLKDVAEGDLNQTIAFRRKDQLDDFALLLNDTVASLAARKAEREKILSDTSQRLEALLQVVNAPSPSQEEAERLTGEIKTFIGDIGDVL